MRQVAAELLVMRKRASSWVLLGTWIGVSMMFAYLLPYITYAGGNGGEGVGLELLLPRALTANLLSGLPTFGGVFALMLGVLTIGSDYGWGTLKTLFVQRSGRLTLAFLSASTVLLGRRDVT